MPTIRTGLSRVLPVAFLLLAACADFEPDPTGPLPPPPPPPGGSAMPFRIGSFGADYAKGVDSDVVGNGYVTSYFTGSVDFDPSAGSTPRASLGGNDIGIAKYAPNGALTWATSIGGPSNDQPFDIAVVADGGAIITGFTSPGATCGGTPIVNAGGRDAVVARISALGTCQWAIGLGGAQDDEGRNVVVRSDGSIVVSGFFRGTADFDPSAATAILTSRGGTDGFVASYSASGAFLAVGQVGGTEDDAALAVASLPSGDVVIGGEFRGVATLGASLGSLPLVSAGDSDFFVARYSDQLELQWGFRGGGLQADQVNTNGIAVDGATIVVVGNFGGVANVGTGSSTVPLASAGGQDIFIARYDAGGFWQGLAQRIGGPGSDGAQSVALDAAGNIVIAGWFQGTVDFDPGAGARNVTALGTAGAGDGFVVSLDPGATLRWVAPIGAVIAGDANFAIAAGVTVDDDGFVWAVGRLFGAVDLDPNAGAVTVQSGGDADQFVVRYSAATGALER